MLNHAVLLYSFSTFELDEFNDAAGGVAGLARYLFAYSLGDTPTIFLKIRLK
jgi:hypothetical protein